MKMLLKRSLLEVVTIISCSGSFFCILLNYVTNISPITGIWFSLYIILLFVLSVLFSFKFIQWLLQINRPIKYDLEVLVKDFPELRELSKYLPKIKKRVKTNEFENGKEYDTNELSVISTVLERKLVSSWYVPYISQEIGFPFACKQLLDQMIGKTFKICDKIETKEVFVDICCVLTTHLKEYRKALKRHEKTPTSTIPSLYKMTHPVSENKDKTASAEHCTNILRIILKELVPWELWDTPHSELLVRILSKKLNSFIENTLVDPVWLNDKLLSIILNEEVEVKTENLEQKVEPEVVQKENESTIESALSTLVTNTTAPILQRDIEEAPAPVLRARRGRQREVKIYDRVVEGSVKTWQTDMDLQCISLGQDLLASLDGEVALSRLWPADEPELLFGEEEALELDPDSPKHSPVKKELSPKPAELLRDLQSTVHSAKTKIGGLQVSRVANDEAAGMMEGLLDFGIAGFKKGLRFTGLSDESQDKSPSYLNKEQHSPPEDARVRPLPVDAREPIISSVIQKEDNGVSVVPQLVKQHRVASQDSVPSQPRPIPRAEPLRESPEPEYEEAADLSASIAKLRSLLRPARASPEREEIWWEGAEETRGRTQRQPCSRAVDAAALADEYDMTLERNASPGQTSNNMQRLDKLFQRTVTGVFNSIKTAVGAEGEEPARTPLDWTYVCTSVELSVGGAVARLVGARRAYTHVDAALDSLEQLPAPPLPAAAPVDFEEWCCVYGAGAGAGALAAAAGLGAGHFAHRLGSLLLADLVEPLLESWLHELAAWLRRQAFAAAEHAASASASASSPAPASAPRALHPEQTCQAIMDKMPRLLFVFGEEALSEAVSLCVASLGHSDVNRDIAFRVLDLLAVRFKQSASLRNPSFDVN